MKVVSKNQCDAQEIPDLRIRIISTPPLYKNQSDKFHSNRPKTSLRFRRIFFHKKFIIGIKKHESLRLEFYITYSISGSFLTYFQES